MATAASPLPRWSEGQPEASLSRWLGAATIRTVRMPFPGPPVGCGPECVVFGSELHTAEVPSFYHGSLQAHSDKKEHINISFKVASAQPSCLCAHSIGCGSERDGSPLGSRNQGVRGGGRGFPDMREKRAACIGGLGAACSRSAGLHSCPSERISDSQTAQQHTNFHARKAG